VAERIKIDYGSCFFKGRDKKIKIDTETNSPLICSQRFLTKIIYERVAEIFEQANKELKEISKEKLLPGGIVLAGGGAKLPKIIELAKSKFSLPVHLGKPKNILGIEPDPSFATICGLALMGLDSQEPGPDLSKRFFSKIKRMLGNLIP
jgi:cell division protein FtsA